MAVIRETTDSEPPPSLESSNKMLRWHKTVLGFCLVIFALELGLFLLIFPWRREWGMNWVPVHSPRLAEIWMSRYVRGAVSGLGLLNIVVALSEFSRQVRLLVAPKI